MEIFCVSRLENWLGLDCNQTKNRWAQSGVFRSASGYQADRVHSDRRDSSKIFKDSYDVRIPDVSI